MREIQDPSNQGKGQAHAEESPIGSVFGSWRVISLATPHPTTGAERWRVECACGATCVRIASVIRGGASKQCNRCAKHARMVSLGHRAGARGIRRAAAARWQGAKARRS